MTAADAPIHVSGHGSREELKLMLNLTRPRYVFPFHGDHKRIRLHAELAEAVGIEPERIFKGRNGLALDISESGARFSDDFHAGMIFVDGVDIGDPDDVALRDRRALSGDGVLIVVATVSSDNGESVADPEVIFRGVPFIEGEDQVELIEEVRDVVDGLPRRIRRRRRRARGRPPSGGPPRRRGRVRLLAPEAPPDGATGRRRGLSPRYSSAEGPKTDGLQAERDPPVLGRGKTGGP